MYTEVVIVVCVLWLSAGWGGQAAKDLGVGKMVTEFDIEDGDGPSVNMDIMDTMLLRCDVCGRMPTSWHNDDYRAVLPCFYA